MIWRFFEFLDFAAEEDGLSEAAVKESLEPNDAASEEFEISGTVTEPKEVMDSHVENSCQTPIKVSLKLIWHSTNKVN